MDLEANCQTTAMGIMPHTDVEKALELALGLDIPFWPQLPQVSFYEDMYAQVSEGFPGIAIDIERERVDFDTARFEDELPDYSQRMGDPETFALSHQYSAVFHRFLERPLGDYSAIRGQTTGPVSFGFKIIDESKRSIIYNEDIRSIMFEFIQGKVNIQYEELARKNSNAFVWLDEPGLGWVFNSLSGYNDLQAKEDYQYFLSGIKGPKALHLCANVNLPYLLGLGVEIISFDAYQLEVMPKGYADAVSEFIESGGIISWGIVPTDSTSLSQETPKTLLDRVMGYWDVVSKNAGISAQRIAQQALIAPARCCLKNVGLVGADDELGKNQAGTCSLSSIEERVVESAFTILPQISQLLREEYSL